MAFCRKVWRKLFAESSVMSPWWPSQSKDLPEPNWTAENLEVSKVLSFTTGVGQNIQICIACCQEFYLSNFSLPGSFNFFFFFFFARSSVHFLPALGVAHSFLAVLDGNAILCKIIAVALHRLSVKVLVSTPPPPHPVGYRRHKLKTHLLRTQSLKVLPFLYISIHACYTYCQGFLPG